MQNRLITKGFTTSGKHSVITKGYGIFDVIIREVVEVSRTIIRVGKTSVSKTLDQIDEIIVYAKLVSINGKEATNNEIKGWIKITYNAARKIFVNVLKSTSPTVRSKFNEIVVYAKRIIR